MPSYAGGIPASQPAPANKQAAKQKTLLKGQIGSEARYWGGVRSTGFGYDCVTSGGRTTITRVAPGSQAALRGLLAGDAIVDKWQSGNTLSIVIERSGKRYQANLTLNAVSLEASRTAEGGSTLARQAGMLANHDVSVIIDKSGSMATRDCPGDSSRWEWCADQTRTLTDAIGRCGVTAGGITIVVFSDDYHTYSNSNVNQVSEIFRSNRPHGKTNTAEALESRIQAYFDQKLLRRVTSPAVMAVVTDGEPSDPQRLRELIIEATRKMTNPNELAITFLQVGNGSFGTALLRELDDNLVGEGARFDIIDTKNFDDLQKAGLTGALAQAITALRTPSPLRGKVATSSGAPLPQQPPYRRPGNNVRLVRPATATPAPTAAPVPPPAAPLSQQLKGAERERLDLERTLLEK